MNQSDFTLGTTSLLRHALAAGAGVLAAHGLPGSSEVVTVGGAVAMFGASLAWSWVEKSKLIASLCEAAPISELEQLASDIVAFRAKGSNPLLIAHIAQTVFQIAQAELAAAHPELVPQPAPAPAPSPPPQASPVQGPEPTPEGTIQ